MDRKTFLSTLFEEGKKQLSKSFTAPILEAIERMETLFPAEEEKVKERPPGSVIEESKFKELCTGCDACMIACPVNVIMIDDLEKRTPLIYPEIAPCISCEGFPCIAACPTGALSFENELIPKKL
ncbi:4Fe-4S dicluster domain-containing protein [Criblamydia sequanensis]|uniref:4Fe-4S ferredoxin-type domain-containing protein n=1 Tax=Candidatus Criblamydia sequanensis CRIB-18 TaxID=1437425 RepID=A0A090DX56_9BACT|nr:4Fe-4S dicluster domain-containing protein [Criblamydia sequanensis]CDR33414.1 Conserved hypothetical protein [Criblamydia sequanensis CRIB-18]